MFLCKIVDFFFRILPVKQWQDFLIRFHIQECTACQSRLAGAEEVKALLVQESEVERFRDPWPAVKAGIREKKSPRQQGTVLRWRWGFAAAGLICILAAGILIFRGLGPDQRPAALEGRNRFQIRHLRVGDKPAAPFLFQPQGTDMIMIWVERNM